MQDMYKNSPFTTVVSILHFTKKYSISLTASAILALTTAHSAKATTYNFTSLNVPGGFATTAYGINNLGEVVGTYQDSSSGYHGFVYSSQLGYTTFDVDVPGAIAGTTQAYGINNSGQIVGGYASQTEYGFIFTPGSGYTQISGPGTNGNGANNAFLRGINDSGTLVGRYTDNSGEEDFIYSAVTGLSNFPYHIDGINNSGQIVGSTGGSGYVYTPGDGFTGLSGLDGFGEAFGINNLGQIVGVSATQGWIYTPGTGYASVVAPFTVYGVNSVLSTTATGINDSDDIVGYYDDSSGQHSFLATPSAAPEPSQFATLGFTAFGALGLIFRARNKDRSRS